VPFPVPEPGLVISYSYLWQSEYRQEREEGVKDRPCAIILVTGNDGRRPVVTVLPITHSPPQNASDAVELPPAVKRRLGLDEARSWAVVSEVNCFIWPGPNLRVVSRDDPERFEYGCCRHHSSARSASAFWQPRRRSGCRLSRAAHK